MNSILIYILAVCILKPVPDLLQASGSHETSDRVEANLCSSRAGFLSISEPFPVPDFCLALPEDFIAESFYSGEEPDLITGILWGSKKSIEYLRIEPSLPLRPKRFPVFFVTVTAYDVQSEIEEFDRGKTEHALFLQGLNSVEISKKYWGDYPLEVVLARRGRVPRGTAAVGLNCGGPALLIEYYFSQDESQWDEEQQIWERFINETRPVKHAP